MRTKLLTALLIFPVFALSCSHKMNKSSIKNTPASSGKIEATASSQSLLNTHWKLTAIKGSVVQNPSQGLGETYIVFMTDSISLTGSGGCNSLFGTYHLRGDNGILIEQVGSTKMFCENMDIEIKMLSALRDVNAWEVRSDSLILKKGGKMPVLSFCSASLPGVDK